MSEIGPGDKVRVKAGVLTGEVGYTSQVVTPWARVWITAKQYYGWFWCDDLERLARYCTRTNQFYPEHQAKPEEER